MNRALRQRSGPSAFTLIELLVVVTIVIVLLALLTPALSAAMYQSKLAVCSAHIDTMVTGVVTYAMDHKRRYPYKRTIHINEAFWTLDKIRTVPDPAKNPEGSVKGERYDYRIQMQRYFQPRLFVDPLAQPVEMRPELTHNNASIFSSYVHPDGFSFRAGGGHGMNKMGDKLEVIDPDGIRRVFNLLAADLLKYRVTGGRWESGHYDRQEALARADVQDGTGGGEGGNGKFVYSIWFDNASIEPTFDLNFGTADGAVQRLINVTNPPWDNPTNRQGHPLTASPGEAGSSEIFFNQFAYWMLEN